MKLLAKIAAAAASLVAVAGFSAANAALVISSPNLSTILENGNPIVLDNDDMSPGMFTDNGSFTVGAGYTGGKSFGAADVRFSSGNPSGIVNMVMDFDVNGTVYSYQITDAAGLQILDFFTLPVVAGATVLVTVTGTVFETLGQQANYNVVLSTPIPAAGVFLLTGLAGLAGTRLRKKTA